MKSLSCLAGLALAAALVPVAAGAQAVVGSPAPEFTATDSHGQTHSLQEYRGKYVVLEWHNHDCPYTKKHYVSGNMQSLQKEWTAKGVVWFTVISSAPGEQGYVTDAEENAYLEQMHAAPTAVLMDPEGKLGHLFSAKTTPEMYVIDPEGKLIYEGAIDDRRHARHERHQGRRQLPERRADGIHVGQAGGARLHAVVWLLREIRKLRPAERHVLPSGKLNNCT